ncbi:ATP-binding protein [Brevundimonas sp. S1H14]|uniref:ATP-binding protein n=1 Tax=Brevundimonas sp. S1H14 TaxID=3078084 RepID=UPI0039ECF905
MAGKEQVSVAVRDDFVARQTRAKPIPALAELIWNALDADATRVKVELMYEDLAGGLSRILVNDNGSAIGREEAATLFGNLGGSWKRLTRETAEGRRRIHGQEGRGRYKAFALGKAVTWTVVHGRPGSARKFDVRLRQADLTNVLISEDVETDEPRGISVEIVDLNHDFRVFETDEGRQGLAEIFALYLINYSNVTVEIAGRALDPASAVASQHTAQLAEILDEEGGSHSAELQIIEWRAETRKTLYLCSRDGFPLDQVETRFQIPGFSFSAYLKSSYIEALQADGRLGLAELDSRLTPVVDQARTAIKDYFRERAAAQARSIIDEWKEARVYPFEGEPASSVERAERQVFDIVASQVQQLAPDLGGGSHKGQALHLRMLKNALERGPEELQTILREVLGLPVKKQKELAALLQETTLSAIITAARVVGDRLKFLDALEAIVFDPAKKARLKERTQLHKILAENTWIFGEEFNLWVSDKGLRKVLEKHRDKLDPSIDIDGAVSVYGQKTAIVDLMFSRSTRRHRNNDVENLVVELKAPKVVIGSDEIVQTKKYQQAVVGDERFSTVPGVRWHFVVVSNAYDSYAQGEIDSGPDPDRRLIARTGTTTVAIKTWGEIIEENRARLQFFQEHLQHSADDSQALKYLQERHAAVLEGVLEPEDALEPDDSADDETP